MSCEQSHHINISKVDVCEAGFNPLQAKQLPC